MTQLFLEMMLGKIGRWVLAFYDAHQVPIVIALCVWMLVVGYGEVNYRAVLRRTEGLILDTARRLTGQGRAPSAQEIYRAIYPAWRQLAAEPRGSITTRIGFWIEPSSPDRLERKMQLSPQFVQRVLGAAPTKTTRHRRG